MSAFETFVHYADGLEHYFTSPLERLLPSPLIKPSPIPPSTPHEFKLRRWALDFHPYLPFVQTSPFSGSFLSRLPASVDGFQVEQTSNNFFILKASKSEKLLSLERNLFALADKLMAEFQLCHPKLRAVIQKPPKPSKFGFNRCFKKRKELLLALSQTLDAFSLLVAWTSFTFALFPSRPSLPPSPEPAWREFLDRPEHGYHREWIKLIADSPMVNFTGQVPRLGTIINVCKISWLEYVPFMLQAKIPLWFYWGQSPYFFEPKLASISQYKPSTRASVPVAAVMASAPPNFPDVEPNSGQRYGEKMQDFFDRRAARNQKWMEHETPTALQSRVSRENNAASGMCPGKRGPTVFVWELIDGFRIRKRQTRNEAEGIWGNFRRSQKRFDSFSNEWDLCVDFDLQTFDNTYSDSDSDGFDDDHSLTMGEAVEEVTATKGSGIHQGHQKFTPHPPQGAPQSTCFLPHSSAPTEVPPPPSTVQIPLLPSSPSSGWGNANTWSNAHGWAQCSSTGWGSNSGWDNSGRVSQPGWGENKSDNVDERTYTIDTSPSVLCGRGKELESIPEPTAIADTPAVIVLPATSLPPMFSTEPSVQLPLFLPEMQEDLTSSWQAQPEKDNLTESARDVILAYSYDGNRPKKQSVESIEDLLFFRFGYNLDEDPFEKILSSRIFKDLFKDNWVEVCRTIGGQHLTMSIKACPAISDFLSILISSCAPLDDMPGKYWDLHQSNTAALSLRQDIFLRVEEKNHAKGKFYILQPCNLSSQNSTLSWILAVDAMTALECIRRGLGPDLTEVASFLVEHGITFKTLSFLEKIPLEFPLATSLIPHLGHRPQGYKFNLADFVAYETLCESVLVQQRNGRAALLEGGIIARLAREILSDEHAFGGPSESALDGLQAKYRCDDGTWVDDEIQDELADFICGTYEVESKNKGIYIFLNYLFCLTS